MILKLNTLYKLIILLIISLVFQQCANVGSLAGGPEDLDPPVFQGSEPPKYSRNITPQKISLQFDEFLVLKSIKENLIISPPLNEDPEVILRGKKVVIKNHKDVVFEENTTYTYYFDDAIVDLHEENPIVNFEYVFSTGASLDSLSIRGIMLNASNLLPEENIYVSLYKSSMNDTIPLDSLPYFVRPYYVSKTNEKGEYQINNIPYGEYLLFGIQDLNSNYYFDMPGEKISFIDHFAIPEEVFEIIPDSIPLRISDTAYMDSIWEFHSHKMVKNPLDLFLFSQDDSIAKLMETSVELGKKIDFYFKFPIRDSLNINILDNSIEEDWYIQEYSALKDTLSLWLTKFPVDTLKISLQVDTLKLDTLDFIVNIPEIKKEDNKRRRRKKEEDKTQPKEDKSIKYTSNLKNLHPYFQDLILVFETPLEYANFEYMRMMEDTVEVKAEVYFLDSIQRKLSIHYDWKEGINYEIFLPQESLRDIFELESDSIVFNFTTSTEDDYGNIEMDITMDSIDKNGDPFVLMLVQGEAESEKIIQKHVIYSDTNIVFKHIIEGDYFLKALKDFNHNGRWNSGHYGRQLLPEPIYFFQKTLSMKEGWDVQDKWRIQSSDKKRPILIKKEEKKGNK